MAQFAVVAIDRHRLQPELPRQHVQRLDVLDRRVLGHVDRLADPSADERLHRRHHPDVALVVDRVVAHRAGEHRQVCRRQVRGPDDRHVLVDVGDDVVDLLRLIAETTQGPRHGLVDDRHRPPTDQLLRLDQRQVGFDPRRVTVHRQADRSGRRDDRGLAVAHAVGGGVTYDRVPGRASRIDQIGRNHAVAVEVAGGLAVHLEHAEHGVGLVGEAVERTDAGGGPSARGVGRARHQRGDCCRPRPALLGVVGQAERHEQRAEVGITQSELSQRPRGVTDLLGRIVRVTDEDLLGREQHVDRVRERPDIEPTIVLQVLQQVDRREIARAVVDVEVLRAVPHDDAVHHVRVVPRLGQVVREFDALVDAIDQTDRCVHVVDLVIGDRLTQHCRLPGQREPDLRCVAMHAPPRDAQVERGLVRGDDRRPVLALVRERLRSC